MTDKDEPYDADYFLRGRETGKSLYNNYTWMPALTLPMATTIVKHCGISAQDRILDFGCARGYTVKALRLQGYAAYGVDTSKWAVENSPDDVKPYISRSINGVWGAHIFDWIIAKDVLEHIPFVNGTIVELMNRAAKGLFVVVPLSEFNGQRYVIEEYEKDVTHIQRMNLVTWTQMFLRPGWRVEASYRVPGIKDNYRQFERGNGFIVARRIIEEQ